MGAKDRVEESMSNSYFCCHVVGPVAEDANCNGDRFTFLAESSEETRPVQSMINVVKCWIDDRDLLIQPFLEQKATNK